MNRLFSILLIYGLFVVPLYAKRPADVLIVGGGASGVTAAISAARCGVNVVVLEEGPWLGGMLTSAGVSAVDGNYKLRGGLFGEFCNHLAAHYGGYDSLKTGWVSNILFEPKVGASILTGMVAKYPNISVQYNTQVENCINKNGSWIISANTGKQKVKYNAKVVVDATELGDIAASCGVKYDVGMDAKAVSGEDIAPAEANDIVQDLTYVAVLKDFGIGANKTIGKPQSYNPSLFYCSTQSDKCQNSKPGQKLWDKTSMITYGKLPNGKYMINWPIEGNDYYLNLVNVTPKERAKKLEKAKEFTLSFLYYIQTELGMQNLGIADDEFPTKDGLPIIPYHRESRRIHGLVRFTVNDVAHPYAQATKLYRTGIGVGDYPIDHHHKRYPEWEKLPELHFYPVPSYNVPLGALIPADVRNLIVAEKSISVSNILNGSTRLQPVVMQIGEAAGILAALAVKKDVTPQDISIRDVQNEILAQGGYIMPYLDLSVADPKFKSIQKIGVTGILKGEGRNIGWSNQTWFNVDKEVESAELIVGLKEYYPSSTMPAIQNSTITVGEAIALLNAIDKSLRIDNDAWVKMGLDSFDASRKITRGELAVLLDATLNPFNKFEINHNGFLK